MGVADVSFVDMAAEVISFGAGVPDSIEEADVDGSTEIAIEIVFVGAVVSDSIEESSGDSKEISVDVISVRVGELVLVGESMSDSVEEIIGAGSKETSL